MSDHNHPRIDLRAAAHQAMLDHGFEPELPPEAAAELSRLGPQPANAASKDLRDLLWSSIDNPDSRDLDQVEVVEKVSDDGILVRIGIADVDSLVPLGSALDQHALANTTSVYTGVVTFPMLPDPLSTDRTSLVAGGERQSIVTEFVVKPDGTIGESDIYRAVVKNHAKLAYPSVGAWLDESGPMPPAVSAVRGLKEQIELQHEAARRLRLLRAQRGSLELETIEAQPVMSGAEVVDLALTLKSGARDLIEDFMVAANGVMARRLQAAGVSSIARVVRVPKRWDRIVVLARKLGTKLPSQPDAPALAAFLLEQRKKDLLHFPDLSLAVVKLLGSGEYVLDPAGEPGPGHFGLAAADYTHSTAPNRRYADLVTQRLIKAVLDKKPAPYSDAQLIEVCARCTHKEDDAQKVERLVRKQAAASLLADRIGKTFDAIVTGVTDHGTYVRMLRPPVEGRVMKGEEGMDVGERVKVRLLHTDPAKGYIDFAGVS